MARQFSRQLFLVGAIPAQLPRALQLNRPMDGSHADEAMARPSRGLPGENAGPA